MKADRFENVRNQIGFCGIWCGSCPGGNGVTMELTRRYEEFVRRRAPALEKWSPKDFDFKEFMKGLASIQRMPSCPGCLEGGGDPNCKIRMCASKKSFVDCSQCDQLMSCENFEILEESSYDKRRLNQDQECCSTRAYNEVHEGTERRMASLHSGLSHNKKRQDQEIVSSYIVH